MLTLIGFLLIAVGIGMTAKTYSPFWGLVAMLGAALLQAM